jgi:catechol 2,3-dioxygenase-like lactoylglutathione lyase family enzyme
VDQRLTLLTLGVSDLAASRRFYVDGLGWEPTLDSDEVVFLQVAPGVLLALWPASELHADIDSGLPAFTSADTAPFALAHNVGSEAAVDAAIEKAIVAGGTVLKPARPAPLFGGRQGYVADPDGFRWEIAYNPGLTVAPDGRVVMGEADG